MQTEEEVTVNGEKIENASEEEESEEMESEEEERQQLAEEPAQKATSEPISQVRTSSFAGHMSATDFVRLNLVAAFFIYMLRY